MVTKWVFKETETFEDAVNLNILDYELKQRASRALRRFLYLRGEESLKVRTKWPVRGPICLHLREAALAPDFFIKALGAGDWQSTPNFEQLAERLVKNYAAVCPERRKRIESPARSAFEEGKAYFVRNKETLIRRYEGKYIAVWSNEILDNDASFSALAQRVYEKLGYVSIYMPFVTAKRRVLRFESPKFRRLGANVA